MHMFQMKVQEKKSVQKYPNKTEVNNLPDKEIKAQVNTMKILTKNQNLLKTTTTTTEVKKRITEIKNMLEELTGNQVTENYI